jgi:hypothetical protein
VKNETKEIRSTAPSDTPPHSSLLLEVVAGFLMT